MSSIVIAGDTSGTCTLQANAVAGTTTLTLPTTSGFLFSSATAGTLGVASGGTGATTLTGLAYGNGTSAFTAASAAQVVAVISTTPVANATYATTAGTATNVAGSGITGSQGIPKAALPTGTVLQTVQTVLNSTFSTSSVSDTALTGLSASITPTSSSSKIAIIVNIGASSCFNSNYGTFFSLYKNGSVITGALGNASGSRRQCTFGVRTFNFANYGVATTYYIDSPATTSSTTYQVYLGMESSNAGFSFVNTSGNSSNDSTVPLSVSTITLMEIAG